MRILADSGISGVAERFAHLGAVERCPGRAIGRASLVGVDILLVRSVTRVDRALLEGSAVRFVGSATSGCDHIDRDWLARSGIGFAHAPGANAFAVVEYVLGAIAAAGARLEALLAGGRLGVVGYGRIGRALARCAGQLGIRCLAYDPWLAPAADSRLVGMERVLGCEVVSLHAELTQREPWPSHHLLDAPKLAAMAGNCLLVNTGRGALIDNRALLDALRARPRWPVALDVWEGEPNIDAELLRRCLLATPHIAGYSHDGKLKATEMLLAAACEFLGRAPPPAARAPARPALTVPSGLRGAALLRFLLRHCHDIQRDDALLRGQLRRVGFDGLRAGYRLRRELSAHVVANPEELEPEQARILRALNCNPRREPA